MKNFSLANWAGALGVVLVLAGCAVSTGPADMGLQQRMEAALSRANPALQVGLKVSASQVKTGEHVTARISSNTAGFAYLVQLDSDARALRLVFPNAVDGANFMGAGTLDLPRGTWHMTTRGPAGVGYVMAFVTPTPMDLPALEAQIAYGKFELLGSYGAAMVPLREIRP